jgi:hypothetical protein
MKVVNPFLGVGGGGSVSGGGGASGNSDSGGGNNNNNSNMGGVEGRGEVFVFGESIKNQSQSPLSSISYSSDLVQQQNTPISNQPFSVPTPYHHTQRSLSPTSPTLVHVSSSSPHDNTSPYNIPYNTTVSSVKPTIQKKQINQPQQQKQQQRPYSICGMNNIMVFCLGGGSIVEYVSLMQWAKQNGKQIIYGSTEILSPSSFLSQLSILGGIA